MKLSDWARKEGITYKTAWQWWRAGILPVSATQVASGTILVEEQSRPQGEVAAVYARVSSSDQRGDLDGQAARVTMALNDLNVPVSKIVTEIGSGLNGHRPKLIGLLRDPSISVVAVEHRDRLMRFGAEYVEAALSSAGRRLTVVEEDEVTDDLVSDMIEVLTSFCARLYGRRSAKNRAKKALAAAGE
jgi:predicted site-specific integrase-resolvase